MKSRNKDHTLSVIQYRVGLITLTKMLTANECTLTPLCKMFQPLTVML